MSEAFPEIVGVASLNVLLDKRRSAEEMKNDPEYVEPQHERIESLGQTLGSLPIPLDVVMLQELHITKKHHNGEALLENLGLKNGFWVQHNEDSRKNEYLGVIGNSVAHAEGFDVGDDRQAILAMVGGIAIVGIHHRAGRKSGDIRTENMKRVIDRIREFDRAIILGDANELPLFESRRLLTHANFRSAYKMKIMRRFLPLPATYPTENYKEIMWTPNQRKAAPRGVALDILELKGFKRSEVISTGTLMTEKSDHKVLFAELAPKN